ncbi:MAG: DUF6077 domain-containing protein [Clostridium sp.]|nr:DUF6077 domain-containing protein [Clostridium sp.]
MIGFCISIILSAVWLIAVPFIIGGVACYVLRLKSGITENYVIGTITVWAVCQLISVPVILLKGSFTIIASLLVGSIIITCFYGIAKKRYKVIKKASEAKSWYEVSAFVIMFLAIGGMVLLNIFLQHTDADDSRFVVNAVDILRTNRLFLFDPATGENTSIWMGELIKDVTSPWAVYIAFCAKLTGCHPTVMAHTMLPVALLLLTCSVYWLLSRELIGTDNVYRCMFVCFAILVNAYGFYSLYSAETFMMTRIWQGKSVVACAGIPMFFLFSMWIYRTPEKKQLYVLLFILSTAMSLLSGMGIIIGAMLSGCVGLAYGIAKKNIRIAGYIWLAAVPGMVFYIISCVI